MKRLVIGSAVAVLLSGMAVAADDTEALIALDKEWGSAVQGQAAVDAINKIVADDMIGISPDGLGTKADQIESATDGSAPNEPYEADQFQVKFLNPDLAIMTHHASGSQSHWSMHVWQKGADGWKVIATASTPEGEDE